MNRSSESPSDGTLIAAVLAGDQERFGELVRRYERPLRCVARSRLGREDWAEDVVQETFLAALRWLESYDSRYSFRTWLWTILLNQCHRCWKKNSRGARNEVFVLSRTMRIASACSVEPVFTSL